MTNFDVFSSQIRRCIPALNTASITMQYKAWCKEQANRDFLNDFDLIQSIEAYINAHMPTNGQICITDVLPEAIEDTVKRWLKKETIPFFELIEGVFIAKNDIAQVKSLAYDFLPIEQVFRSRCAECNLQITFADVYHFCRNLPSDLVHKTVFHPVHPTIKEFFYYRNMDTILCHVNRWCMIAKAELPSPSPEWCSLLTAASQCEVAVPVMLDWLSEHHWEQVQEDNAQVLVSADFLTKVIQNKQNMTPIKNVIDDILKERDIPQKWRAKVSAYLQEETNSNPPDWLVIPAEVPGASSLKKDLIRDAVAAKEDLSMLLDDYPYRSVVDLPKLTEFKTPQLKQLLENGIIKGTVLNGTYYISPNEYAFIQKFCMDHESLDDVMERLVKTTNSSFKVKLSGHRRSFIDYLSESSLYDELIFDDGTYPKNSKLFGVFVTAETANRIQKECALWMQCFQYSYSEKIDAVITLIASKKYIKTAKAVKEFIKNLRKKECGKKRLTTDKTITDMLVAMQQCLDIAGTDIANLSEKEIEEIFVSPFCKETIASAELLDAFLYESGYTKRHYSFERTGYKPDTTAYPYNAFAWMVAAVVSDVFWERNDLIKKAVANPKYAALWIFFALHILAAWRKTDYARLPLPTLQYQPDQVLQMIADGTYSSKDAILVAELYLDHIKSLDMRPNKTSNKDGETIKTVPLLYICCPESCKEPLGIILSIAAAHYIKSGKDSNTEPFVQVDVSDIATIKSFFGNEVAQACGYKAFSTRRANKALLQSIEVTAIANGKSPYIAFTMASTVRAHKFDWMSSLSPTTAIYLEDGEYSGYNPEYIVEQMFQRGVLSFITDNLLRLAYGEQYTSLPISSKTSIIKNIGVDVNQIDNIVHCVQVAERNATKAIKTVLSHENSTSPREILESIAFGRATGKDQDTICICHAAGIGCQCLNRRHCLGCIYEVKSKNVLLQYFLNYDQQLAIVQDTSNKYSKIDKERAAWMISNVLAPALSEMRTCLINSTTKEEYEAYSEIIRERKKQIYECPYISRPA